MHIAAAQDLTIPVYTQHWLGYASIALFLFAYAMVMTEELTHMRKSKPVMLAAGLMWAMIAAVYAQQGASAQAVAAARHHLLDFTEIFLFLIAAMTYINALEDRNVFDALRAWLVNRGYGYRTLFWYTGILAFFISAVADNLTTALVMCAVVTALGRDNARFVSLGCINLVVAANSGGAFSPFGDITTLMVWQKGVLDFWTFFHLFIPSVVSFVVPALLMHFAVPKGTPEKAHQVVAIRHGGIGILVLFSATITLTVLGHSLWHLPPVFGMMSGLACLQIYGYFLRTRKQRSNAKSDAVEFEIFSKIARVEWDTLLFFYGVVMCVGALGFLGYLNVLSTALYTGLGATIANSTIGVISSVIDNIPVMFAVLNMQPEMSVGQWLLVTLTAGIGGSLLSIGSAAGVALMGQARGVYTFSSHLRWTPAIAAGYVAGILSHLWINSTLF